MDRENNVQHEFTYMRGNYVEGDGDYIVCMMGEDEYCDITVNLPWVQLEKDTILIPDKYENDPAIKTFYERFVLEILEVLYYGNFNSSATRVLLKPNWREHIKQLG